MKLPPVPDLLLVPPMCDRYMFEIRRAVQHHHHAFIEQSRMIETVTLVKRLLGDHSWIVGSCKVVSEINKLFNDVENTAVIFCVITHVESVAGSTLAYILNVLCGRNSHLKFILVGSAPSSNDTIIEASAFAQVSTNHFSVYTGNSRPYGCKIFLVCQIVFETCLFFQDNDQQPENMHQLCLNQLDQLDELFNCTEDCSASESVWSILQIIFKYFVALHAVSLNFIEQLVGISPDDCMWMFAVRETIAIPCNLLQVSSTATELFNLKYALDLEICKKCSKYVKVLRFIVQKAIQAINRMGQACKGGEVEEASEALPVATSSGGIESTSEAASSDGPSESPENSDNHDTCAGSNSLREAAPDTSGQSNRLNMLLRSADLIESTIAGSRATSVDETNLRDNMNIGATTSSTAPEGTIGSRVRTRKRFRADN